MNLADTIEIILIILGALAAVIGAIWRLGSNMMNRFDQIDDRGRDNAQKIDEIIEKQKVTNGRLTKLEREQVRTEGRLEVLISRAGDHEDK